MVRPYSRYSGSRISQSDSLWNVYFSFSFSRTGRKPYSSPLQTTASSPRKKGCMPSGERPMMARRWKQRKPVFVSTMRDMSGPRETVFSKPAASRAGEMALLSTPMMEHIKNTSG